MPEINVQHNLTGMNTHSLVHLDSAKAGILAGVICYLDNFHIFFTLHQGYICVSEIGNDWDIEKQHS